MNYRPLGRTGWNVSEISFGAWAVGGAWGTVDDAQSLAALRCAVDQGINFFDTADVYGDGRSERLLAQLKQERREEIVIATKVGRRLPEFSVKAFNRENLGAAIDRCRENLQMDCLDLVQLHCPPTDLYYAPEVFGLLDDFVQAGKIRFYGVSVERVEEALKAIEYPGVQTVQIIFNMLRHRPADLFFAQAKQKKIGILARVPLASGLLTGRMKPDTQFAVDDHRQFNRHGEYFDVGETFSGVDYDAGLQAVEELRALVPAGATLAQFALRWILMFDAVTCAIPGGKTPQQVMDNARAASLPALTPDQMAGVRSIYGRYARGRVHQRW
ncbi:MAG TPA: aldo/keto reductase [Chthoniobacteraceae bacterium]|nr:aldo/keto reductase [Chthoniobacteraceae bacterium]